MGRDAIGRSSMGVGCPTGEVIRSQWEICRMLSLSRGWRYGMYWVVDAQLSPSRGCRAQDVNRDPAGLKGWGVQLRLSVFFF